LFAQRKWFLVTTGKLTAGQKKPISAEIDFFPSFYLIDI
ncbi:helix-turn-helix-type transcriptional regulator, partial [Salmonella enterica subsp. enterica serovar Dublin]